MEKEPVQSITSRNVPDLSSAQLQEFSRDSLHEQIVRSANPERIFKRLVALEGQKVLGADLGGDKGIVRSFKIINGELNTTTDYASSIQGDDGAGYLQLLKDAGQYAERNELPFGISWGGPLEGTRPLFHPKAKRFLDELRDQFDGDLSNISPSIKAAMNDGPAGALSGATEAYRKFGISNSIFIINGGGIGTSVVKDDVLYAVEGGHVRGVDELNQYNQTTECGVYGNAFTCLERLGANKAGIEVQWQEKTGSYMRARDIEDRYKEGNVLAAELYDHSAWVLAHVILGTAQAYEVNLSKNITVVVGHGGAFKFPDYGNRISQILEKHINEPIELIMTKDFGADDSNACLDGAAIAAISNSWLAFGGKV